jgi:hypothetical protein
MQSSVANKLERRQTRKVSNPDMKPIRVKGSKESGGYLWQLDDGHRACLHREEIDPITGLSLPAVEGFHHTNQWWVNGKLHREDGPAIEFIGESSGDYPKYYINGINIPQLDGKRIYGKENLIKYLILI